jgi:hypothetical protein
MKLSAKIIAAFCLLVFISCNKPSATGNTPSSDTTRANTDTNVIAKDTIIPPANIYIVGEELHNYNSYIKYWNNGSSFLVSDSLHYYVPTSLFVSGSDIYVSGYQQIPREGDMPGYNLAQYWKNGVATRLVDSCQSGEATGITVSGNDVYVLEQEYYDSLPNYRLYTVKYWKNGIPVKLITRDGWAGARSILVSGNDVYVAGSVMYEKNGINYYTAAVYWKNGKIIYLTDGTETSDASSIVVSGNDVYVAGHEDYKAKYWKNGVAVGLPESQSLGYRSDWVVPIAVSNNDVYVAASLGNGNEYIAKQWQNGIEQDLFEDGTDDVETTGIAISGKDVYVTGYGDREAIYWKNGVTQVLPRSQFNYDIVRAMGIFVTK